MGEKANMPGNFEESPVRDPKTFTIERHDKEDKTQDEGFACQRPELTQKLAVLK